MVPAEFRLISACWGDIPLKFRNQGHMLLSAARIAGRMTEDRVGMIAAPLDGRPFFSVGKEHSL